MTPLLPARGLVLVFAAVALAACASNGDASGGSGAPPAKENASSPAPSMPSTPAVVAPVSGTQERAASWRLAGVSPDGRTVLLDVEIGGPPCDVVTAVDVTERTDEVRIAVHAGRQSGAHCGRGVPAILGTVRVAAHLSHALGRRPVTR